MVKLIIIIILLSQAQLDMMELGPAKDSNCFWMIGCLGIVDCGEISASRYISHQLD